MRLIDADRAIDELGVGDTDIYCKYHIEDQPTAYDVEAVVKALEQQRDHALDKARANAKK